MAKKFTKVISAMLALVMCFGTVLPVFAEENKDNFNAMGLEGVVSSSDEYTYMIAQDLEDKIYYYATSNHALKIANAGAVHIFPIIDTTRDVENGTWEANGVYVSGESNYDVVYCCDFSTGTRVDEDDVTNTYYKRLNLEDSEYFDDTLAERLRAIVSISYPALSVEDAKASLIEAGFDAALAEKLDYAELISATQGAIWRLANKGDIIEGVTDFTYRSSVTTAKKKTWGGYMYDFEYTKTDGAGDRITALQEFFLTSVNENFLANGKAQDGQIVITKLEVLETAPSVEARSGYNVSINLELNYAVGAEDDIILQVFVGDEINEISLPAGTKTFTVNVDAAAGETVKAVVTGTQKLKKGVYFYAPEPQDIDGDGVATSREVSQNLIGVSGGETSVCAEAEVIVPEPPTVKFKNGDASNISFMLIDEKGNVTFLEKIDIGGETSFVIPTAIGMTSAVFVKQSTSGMFWTSEEIDEATQAAVIKCLKANNPSYKGHWDEFFFGAGNFTWEFKKNKSVTYTFTGATASVADPKEEESAEESVVIPEVEEPVEEPVEETTSKKNNGNGNGNNKNKDKNKNKNK